MIINDINLLTPRMKKKVEQHMKECHEEGLMIEPFETLRDYERQKRLVANGKSRTLKSNHLTGNAVDYVFRKDGKITREGDRLSVITIGKKYGLRNLAPLEYCHFEDDGTDVVKEQSEEIKQKKIKYMKVLVLIAKKLKALSTHEESKKLLSKVIDYFDDFIL